MKMLTLLEAVVEFDRLGLDVIIAQHEALEECAKLVQTQAKDIIGHYQTETGPFKQWAPLADSTLREKRALGYAPPDNPLLRTGDLRDSIERSVDAARAFVGSDEDIAVWQEMGTKGPDPKENGYHIPPRSFLGAAAFQKEDEVAEILMDGVVAHIVGGTRRLIR